MTNPLELVRQIDTPNTTKRDRTRLNKSRRQRRREERDHVKAAKLNQKKNDRLSV